MNRTKGRLVINSREGRKVLSYEEHPRGDGCLQATGLEKPMSARELRVAANSLETEEKELVRRRTELQESES